MAHSQDVRDKVRRAYVFNSLSLEIAAMQGGVSFATARRWKKEASEAGDDWDKIRTASVMAGGGLEEVARTVLIGLVAQYQSTIETITFAEMKPQEKVEMLASLADAYNKSISASRKKKIIWQIYLLMGISIWLAPLIWIKIGLFFLTLFITYYLFKVIPNK